MKNLLFVSNFIVIILLCLLLFLPAFSEEAPYYDTSFEGAWKTNYGELIMQIDGNNIDGIYHYIEKNKKIVAGIIKGVITDNGRKINGLWDQGQTGKFEFILSSGGKKFNGKFWYSDKSYGGEWNGSKLDRKNKITQNFLWV